MIYLLGDVIHTVAVMMSVQNTLLRDFNATSGTYVCMKVWS